MATIIRPASGESWDKVFPQAYEAREGEELADAAQALGRQPKWYTLNSVLYLLAAFLSRGTATVKAKDKIRVWVMNILITSWVNDNPFDDYDSDKDMASLGRYVWWLVKVLDTNPTTRREHVSISIGETRDARPTS